MSDSETAGVKDPANAGPGKQGISLCGGRRVQPVRSVRLAAALWVGLFAACGYHVGGAVGKMPDGIQSLGVPTFTNLSHEYRIEQRISGALLKELSSRTRIPVRAAASGVDAVLVGEIRNVSSSPVTFGGDTFGSAFLVTVQIAVKLVRTRDQAVLWQNDDFLYRERYTLNIKVNDFFSEEGPALDRLARDLSGSLVSTLLNKGKP